jgi:hypothetical protein
MRDEVKVPALIAFPAFPDFFPLDFPLFSFNPMAAAIRDFLSCSISASNFSSNAVS